MSEPLSAAELGAQHSDATDVTISDVALLQLSVESLTRLVGARPAAIPDPYHQSRYADLLDGISVALADLRAAANRMPNVDQGLVAAIYNLERAMEKHGGRDEYEPLEDAREFGTCVGGHDEEST